MTAYRVAPHVAWVEGQDGGSEENVAWVSHLPSGRQFELTDTGWLIWVLVADGFGEAISLRTELARVHADAGHDDPDALPDVPALVAFLEDLERDGLLLRS